MENNILKVGDLIFLFYEKSGIIAPARILEKTIKENIDIGLKVEYSLEIFMEDSGHLEIKKAKFAEGKAKMFSSLEDLKAALEAHIQEQINSMLSDCSSTYELAKNLINGEEIEKSIVT